MSCTCTALHSNTMQRSVDPATIYLIDMCPTTNATFTMYHTDETPSTHSPPAAKSFRTRQQSPARSATCASRFPRANYWTVHGCLLLKTWSAPGCPSRRAQTRAGQPSERHCAFCGTASEKGDDSLSVASVSCLCQAARWSRLSCASASRAQARTPTAPCR